MTTNRAPLIAAAFCVASVAAAFAASWSIATYLIRRR